LATPVAGASDRTGRDARWIPRSESHLERSRQEVDDLGRLELEPEAEPIQLRNIVHPETEDPTPASRWIVLRLLDSWGQSNPAPSERASMSSRLRRQFWIEAGLAALSSALLTLTLVLPDWIELVFGVDPDQQSGSLEWAITGVFGVVSVCAVVLARREWERRLLDLAPTR
jgi:hypothetical protein